MRKLIIIALIMCIITGFSVYYYADNLEKNFKIKTVPVVVAIKKIPKYTLVVPEMVTVKQLSQDAVNVLAAQSVNDVSGRITQEDMEPDEQILTTKISEPGKKDNTLFYTIKEGYRALTISTDEITGVAGYINKGDHIDITAIMIKDPVAKVSTSEVIVENIEVLETGIKSADNVAGQYSSITISVKAEDVLKTNYALSEGKYRIILRAVLEKNIIT